MNWSLLHQGRLELSCPTSTALTSVPMQFQESLLTSSVRTSPELVSCTSILVYQTRLVFSLTRIWGWSVQTLKTISKLQLPIKFTMQLTSWHTWVRFHATSYIFGLSAFELYEGLVLRWCLWASWHRVYMACCCCICDGAFSPCFPVKHLLIGI